MNNSQFTILSPKGHDYLTSQIFTIYNSELKFYEYGKD